MDSLTDEIDSLNRELPVLLLCGTQSKFKEHYGSVQEPAEGFGVSDRENHGQCPALDDFSGGGTDPDQRRTGTSRRNKATNFNGPFPEPPKLRHLKRWRNFWRQLSVPNRQGPPIWNTWYLPVNLVNSKAGGQKMEVFD